MLITSGALPERPLPGAVAILHAPQHTQDDRPEEMLAASFFSTWPSRSLKEGGGFGEAPFGKGVFLYWEVVIYLLALFLPPPPSLFFYGVNT